MLHKKNTCTLLSIMMAATLTACGGGGGSGNPNPPPATTDTDNDTVVDGSDNCPNIANPAQLDTDNDGTGDVCDSTPNGNNTQPVMFFAANDGTTGVELHKTDGTTAGTSIVKNINGGGLSSNPSNFIQLGNKTLFTANDGINGVELWETDGTLNGTKMIKNIRAAAVSSNPTELTKLGNKVIFSAIDTTSNGQELWVTDGTEAGTQLLANINTTPNAGSFPADFTEMGGKLYFTADQGNVGTRTGRELWMTDGTTAGTQLVADIDTGVADSNPADLTVLNNKLYFSANNTSESTPSGIELYVSDGTAAGTVRFSDINLSGPSTPTELTVMNGNLYFVATDGITGRELYKTDGTSAPTRVSDINPSPGGNGFTGVGLLTAVGNKLYFRANAGNNVGLPTNQRNKGLELWETDGTAAGTTITSDINTGAANSTPANLTVLGSTLYFTAISATFGNELHKVDSSGAVVVKDINPTLAASTPLNLTEFGGKLLFSATEVIAGRELYISDGTSAGTVLVKDINNGAANSSPAF